MSWNSIGTPWLWAGFLGFVLVMLALDLGVFNRRAHVISAKEALGWSAAWITLSLLFNFGLYVRFGADHALEFTAGYLIEKALAVDNIFVFMVVFRAFAVPKEEQHRVLFWGVLGALVMRAAFIFAGGALLQHFHWAMYVFGAMLAVTGLKLLWQKNQPVHPENNLLVRWAQRVLPSTSRFHEDKFVVRKDGRYYATPLLLALVAVEATDLIFAVDSIPAIFAVTSDPFIIFTSNIFAILGLRSLYFLLSGVITKFAYLKVGMSLVLVFVGAKMLLVPVYKVPMVASLGIIAGIVGGSILASLLKPPAACLTTVKSAGAS
jgi:tellurite resistance protein TerC